MSQTDDNVIVTEDNLRVVFDDMGGMAMAEALLAGEVMAAVGQHTQAKASGDVLAELEAAKVLMDLLGRLMKPRRAVILQNRDRSTPAMIAQMTAIAAMPDYFRVAPTKEFASGTPIVFGNDDALPGKIALGRKDKAVAADGRRFAVQYAVVEANDLLTSNSADGLAVADYASGASGKLRAIAGNGRLAGLKGGYQRGTAAEYRRELAEDDAHGIAPAELERFDAPILVRIMRAEDVTENIGDISNQRGTSDLSPVEQAQNDSKRLNLAELDVADDGKPTEAAALAFIAAMPESERNNLMDGKHPGQKAYDRLMASVFWQAYNDPELVRLYAQSVDAEVKTILGGMASASAELARLEGAGELDIRGVVTEAASLAVNAKRQGVKLADFAKQTDLTLSADTMEVVRMFVENIRSAKKIGERLRAAARFAYDEFTKDDSDMFGAVEKASRAQVLERLAGAPEEPSASLFDSVDPMLALQLIAQLVQKTNSLKAADGDPMATLQLAGEVVAIIKQLQESSAELETVTVKGDELGEFPDTPEGTKALRDAAMTVFEGLLGKWIPCPAIGADVEFRKSGMRKVKATSADRRKLQLIPALPAIIRGARRVEKKATYADKLERNIVAYHIMAAQVDLEGTPLNVRLVLREDDKGAYHYDHTVHSSVQQILDDAKANGPAEADPFTATNYDSGARPTDFRMAGGPTLLPGQEGATGAPALSVAEGPRVFNLFIEGEEAALMEDEAPAASGIDPFEPPVWELPLEAIRAMSAEDFAAARASLVAANYHAEELVLRAARDGTSIQFAQARALMTEREAAGALTPELKQRTAALESTLAAMAAPAPQPVAPEPAKEPINMENYIRIAADSIDQLRRIDVYRVLEALKADNIDGVTRGDLAGYIVSKRPELSEEVTSVMAEEFPDDLWGTPVAPETPPPVATVQTATGADVSPANPERAADLAFLRGVASQSVDMWSEAVGDRLEAVVAKHPDDAEVQGEWMAAVNTYTDFMAKAIAQPA